jgi:hypothetical protein
MIDLTEHTAAETGEANAPDLFEPGDPRAGPFTPAQIEEARHYAGEPDRWHKLNRSVDWFAVRLQHGRGLTMSETADLFRIKERQIYRRRDRHSWSPLMAERDRRWLARLVWLAGEARFAPDDAEGRRMLARVSEWRLFKRPEPPRWQPRHPEGEFLPFRLGDDASQ